MTKIEWTHREGTTGVTWNPIAGCTKISEGCAHCYAERMATRLKGRFGYPEDEPFRVTLHPDRLSEPRKWRKPRTVFVCSMGDLFHEVVPGTFIHHIWIQMALCRDHTFLVLTKRPERMAELVPALNNYEHGTPNNVWLGVTAENQQRANERIPLLLQTPAAVRFVSIEPMLGPVDLRWYLGTGEMLSSHYLDWVIVGGESGPGARPMHPDWARGVRDQCAAAGVPFFFKQWGSADQLAGRRAYAIQAGWRPEEAKGGHLLDGREYHEWPTAWEAAPVR